MLVKDSVNLSVRRAGVMWELCVFSFFIFLYYYYYVLSPERVPITTVSSEAEALT